jgi:hypothetical protein
MRISKRVLAFLAVLPMTVAASNTFAGETFTNLFAQACVAHFQNPERLRDVMAAQNVAQLPPDQAAVFLGGATGAAWGVQVEDSKYVVTLSDYRVCSVFAQHAAVEEVQERFTELVNGPPEPYSSARLDDAVGGPNTDVLRSVAYAWFRPGDRVQFLFRLTTSSADNPNVQAMASLAVLIKPD